MGNIYSDIDLVTESDVEQKFIYKLLTTPSPVGLGYSDADFRTKADIRKLTIDKGANRKLYYPDYAIITNGLPTIIIEAKTPGENIDEAIRQARLYATEINSMYKNNINPCSRVIVTDGEQVVACFWDQDVPYASFLVKEIDPLNSEFDKFLKFVSRQEIVKLTDDILKTIKKSARYFKPVHMLGGNTVINETVGENSFGANVSLDYKYLFNPEALEDREAIVANAYIQSRRKEAHISPIDKIIRAALPVSVLDSKQIDDTANPKEIIQQLSNHKNLKNEICLLIGSVGSGKSTFTDYLRIVALPDALKSSTEWININLNKAPLSREIIYKWIVSEAIKEIKNKHKDIDFDDISVLKKIYLRQLNSLEKGRAALFPKDSDKYIEIIYEELKRLQSDDNQTLEALIYYLYVNRNKLFVVVLDNCDKRIRDDQLLMFEVATWLKNTFTCLIFLPLRDTTYDQYYNEPPLDTVIKDLVFRIDPPLLEKVIYARLDYALREITTDNSKFSFYINNNARVECDRNEVGQYLRCIVSSLFQDNFFKRIIIGLAGRNIRRGLEILLDFSKSGHISTDEILKVRLSQGDYKLSSSLIARILLRGKRKYYSDEQSNIKNLFYSESDDALPDPFVRIAILRWLKNKSREFGPNRIKGYHKVVDLIRALQSAGHSRARIVLEIETLSKANCVNTESEKDDISDDDLISIAPGGYIHLDLLRDLSYLQAISEDTYFRENQVAKKISDNIIGRGPFKHLSKQSAISCSSVLIDYMLLYHQDYFLGKATILADDSSDDYIDLPSIKNYIDNIADNDSMYSNYKNVETDYPIGTLIEAQIVSVQQYGFFVEFGLSGTGLIHKSNFGRFNHKTLESNESGDWVLAEIIEYDHERKRFKLKLIEI